MMMNPINYDYGSSLQQPMPIGFRFLPTDAELIEAYLKHKLVNSFVPYGYYKPFLDVQLYNHNPQDLVGMHEQMERDQESWYFFTSRERKYQNGNRPRRTAGDGYWKATGKDTEIVGHDGSVVGFKKVLDFYTGKYPNGNRTEWKMHEYLTKEQKDHPNAPITGQNSTKLNDWVLCKIYKNRRGNKKSGHNVHDQNNVISVGAVDDQGEINGYYQNQEPDDHGEINGYYQNQEPDDHGEINGYYQNPEPDDHGEINGYYQNQEPDDHGEINGYDQNQELGLADNSQNQNWNDDLNARISSWLMDDTSDVTDFAAERDIAMYSNWLTQ